MICLLHFNQPGINADISFGEFTVVSSPAGVSQGAEPAGEVSLKLLLEFTVSKKRKHTSAKIELWVLRM
jgi:hypothetical protein